MMTDSPSYETLAAVRELTDAEVRAQVHSALKGRLHAAASAVVRARQAVGVVPLSAEGKNLDYFNDRAQETREAVAGLLSALGAWDETLAEVERVHALLAPAEAEG